VRLNRPEKLNAINDEMDLALFETWKTVNEDESIWCCVISGAGERAFCVGADISGARAGQAGLAFGGGLTGVGGPQLALRKPLIAAVHGYCLGGGFELAMCADMIIASEDAIFGLPETSAGIIAHCGVVHRAVRRLPHSIAMGMILANARLSACDAERFGLANKIATKASLLSEAWQWASNVAACSPLANAAAKAAALRGLEGSLTSALTSNHPEIENYGSSHDAAERDEAAAGNRTPIWRGR
jgi:crotonobetainyl-CoA hydratase